MYSTCVLFLYLEIIEILKHFFFWQRVWILAFSALKLSPTDLNERIEIMNSVLAFFFNCSKRDFSKAVVRCFSKWAISIFHFAVCFAFSSVITTFSLRIWMVKGLKKSILFSFFSFVGLATWNGDEMMMFFNIDHSLWLPFRGKRSKCKIELYGKCKKAVNCQIDHCPSLQETGQLYIPKIGRWPDGGCPRSDLQRRSDLACRTKGVPILFI